MLPVVINRHIFTLFVAQNEERTGKAIMVNALHLEGGLVLMPSPDGTSGSNCLQILWAEVVWLLAELCGCCLREVGTATLARVIMSGESVLECATSPVPPICCLD